MLDILLQPESLTKLGIVLGLLVLSGFFSGSETALTAASRARIHAKAKGDQKTGTQKVTKSQQERAQIVANLLERRERLIGALLLGNNLVNILAASLMTGLMLDIFGPLGTLYATGVMTVLILIFAEVLPKTYAITKPDSAAMAVAYPVRIIVWTLAPIVAAIQVLVNAVLRLFGVSADTDWTAADEIRGAVDLHHSEGSVEKSERDQLLGVLTISDLTVEDVMIHRKNLAMVDVDMANKDIVNKVLDSGHTRVPLWRDNQDNVIGILNTKDMLKAISRADGDMENIDFKTITRDPWFVPETTSVVTQLRAFQHKREHFALCVDEYGALMGVVTLEDILEEIVGDIKDEFDDLVQGVRQQKDGSIIVQGDVPIRDINRARDWNLPDEDAVTIAGLVIHESQTIPDIGRVFSFHGYRFEVLKRHRNQITSVKVKKWKT